MREVPSPARFFDVERIGEVVVVTLPGPDLVDEDTIRVIERQLDHLVTQSGCRYFVLNLGGVTAMTSLMLAKLVRFHQKVQDADGRLVLSELGPEVYRKFEWTRLTRVFRIFPRKEEALRGIAQDRA